MCPQYRQRQTSEQRTGQKRYSGTLPRRLREIPTFLRNLTEYIDIKTFFILYAFSLSEHRYIFSKKARYPT